MNKNMNDDFNFEEFLGHNDNDKDDLTDKVNALQEKIKDSAMREAYGFIEEVGILFWIRRDMYIKNGRKKNILNSMILYFEKTEEYEKCAYLLKGIKELDLYNEQITK